MDAQTTNALLYAGEAFGTIIAANYAAYCIGRLIVRNWDIKRTESFKDRICQYKVTFLTQYLLFGFYHGIFSELENKEKNLREITAKPVEGIL